MERKIFIEILKHLYKELSRNNRVKEIYNTRLNYTSIEELKKEYGIELSSQININELLFNLFKIADYLKEGVTKNDSENSNISNIESDIYDLCQMAPNDLLFINNELKLDIAEKYLLLKTLTMLLSYSISTIVTKDISKFIDKEINKIYRENNDLITFYRGHTDASYKLIPSMYRNYRVINTIDCLMDKSRIFSLYHEATLISKYNNVFGFKSVNYEFCSFMQHATSYSPLLDLTSNHIIALSFATHKNSNVNNHLKTKAALFKFTFKKEIVKDKSESDIDNINVFIFPSKMWLNTIYNNRRIFLCLPNDFNPEIVILNEKSNDRMRYQEGSFLLFKKCVIVNGNILIPYKLGNITKYIIPYSKKESIYKDYIYNKIKQDFSQYQYEYLMNPYKYFDENPLP